MDNRRDLTKRLIADGFKELVSHNSFDKISIMMITNAAEIRRPTFYNHFQDKYDLLEWIVAEEVIAPAAARLRRGDRRGALLTLFEKLTEDAAFYRRAFLVTGQNGFEEAFIRRLRETFLSCLSAEDKARLPEPLTPEFYAHYNAVCLVSMVRGWIESGQTLSPKQLADAYYYLSDHSLWREYE